MRTGIWQLLLKETDGAQYQICIVSYRYDSFKAYRVQTLRAHWSICSFSLQSDFRRTLIWRAPGTRYHQEHTIERHRYSGAGWLVWGGIILGSRTDLHVQSVTMTGHIYRDVILEQHVRLFRFAMGDEFLFMDDNARPYRANIVDECLQSEDITRMDRTAYSPDLNPIVHVWIMLARRIAARQPPPTCLPEFQRALLDECGVIFPKNNIDNLILSMPRRSKHSVPEAMTKRVLLQCRLGASASFVHVVLRKINGVEVKVLIREVGSVALVGFTPNDT
ncbi:transposable element Tcb2 transposase [Trichonephila clavipes]|nr:transposable element Tcb2 transposase [Trichonephila clavipes]